MFLPAAEHLNKASKPKSSLGVFLLSFTVDGGLWVSQAWQEPSWGRGTRLLPLRSSQQRAAVHNRPSVQGFVKQERQCLCDRVSSSGTAGVVPREQHGVYQTVQDLSGGC